MDIMKFLAGNKSAGQSSSSIRFQSIIGSKQYTFDNVTTTDNLIKEHKRKIQQAEKKGKVTAQKQLLLPDTEPHLTPMEAEIEAHFQTMNDVVRTGLTPIIQMNWDEYHARCSELERLERQPERSVNAIREAEQEKEHSLRAIEETSEIMIQAKLEETASNEAEIAVIEQKQKVIRQELGLHPLLELGAPKREFVKYLYVPFLALMAVIDYPFNYECFQLFNMNKAFTRDIAWGVSISMAVLAHFAGVFAMKCRHRLVAGHILVCMFSFGLATMLAYIVGSTRWDMMKTKEILPESATLLNWAFLGWMPFAAAFIAALYVHSLEEDRKYAVLFGQYKFLKVEYARFQSICKALKTEICRLQTERIEKKDQLEKAFREKIKEILDEKSRLHREIDGLHVMYNSGLATAQSFEKLIDTQAFETKTAYWSAYSLNVKKPLAPSWWKRLMLAPVKFFAALPLLGWATTPTASSNGKTGQSVKSATLASCLAGVLLLAGCSSHCDCEKVEKPKIIADIFLDISDSIPTASKLKIEPLIKIFGEAWSDIEVRVQHINALAVNPPELVEFETVSGETEFQRDKRSKIFFDSLAAVLERMQRPVLPSQTSEIYRPVAQSINRMFADPAPASRKIILVSDFIENSRVSFYKETNLKACEAKLLQDVPLPQNLEGLELKVIHAPNLKDQQLCRNTELFWTSFFTERSAKISFVPKLM